MRRPIYALFGGAVTLRPSFFNVYRTCTAMGGLDYWVGGPQADRKMADSTKAVVEATEGPHNVHGSRTRCIYRIRVIPK